MKPLYSSINAVMKIAKHKKLGSLNTFFLIACYMQEWRCPDFITALHTNPEMINNEEKADELVENLYSKQ